MTVTIEGLTSDAVEELTADGKKFRQTAIPLTKTEY